MKVDLEEEEESDSKWLMKFLLKVSAQVIIQFLYGSCSKRRREQKEKITEDESKSGGVDLTGGDESIEDDEDEFELIQEEKIQIQKKFHKTVKQEEVKKIQKNKDVSQKRKAEFSL